MSSYIVHIEGPDDVLYYETEEKATKHAAAFNAYFAEIANPDRPLWPHLRAVVYTHEEWAGRRREILDAP